MPETPIRDALKKLEHDPLDTAELGVVASREGGVGVAGGVSKGVGKGWSLNAQGQWVHKTGWSLAAVARWKGR